MKARMQALFNRAVTMVLVFATLLLGSPVLAYAETSSTGSDSSSSAYLDTSMVEALTFAMETGESTDATSDDEDEASDEAEEADEEETTTYTASTTVDEDGNVVEGSGSSLSLLSTDGTTGTDGTTSDGTTADDDTTAEAEPTTSYTYDLSIQVTTTLSGGIVKTIKVTKPVLTVTTTVTAADGTVTSTSSASTTYGLTVSCYVRSDAWHTASATSDGTAYSYTASKSSSGYYISAIKITPSSALKTAMSTAGLTFAYRATVESFGTLGWAKAGYTAGTGGNNLGITALELDVFSTDEAAALDTTYRYISKPMVTYRTKYSGSSSWSSAKTNGATSGTAKSTTKTLGSVAAKLTSTTSFSGSIAVSVRTSKSDSSSNWSSYKYDYSTAGSTNSKIKAIKIKLTGDMATYYNVYYRVYVKGFGWLGWAKNGEKAGTKNISTSISAVQVKLVPKANDAPGSSTYRFVSSSTTKMKMVLKAQSYSSSTKYLILVDRSACRIGIFTGKKNNWTLKYYWQCCVGKSSTPTVSGSFTVGSKGYSFGTSSYTCYYYTQFYGNYLFHSVLYKAGTFTIKDGTMGKAVSHGCVRLTLSHAKWIYKNIPKKTKVYIY